MKMSKTERTIIKKLWAAKQLMKRHVYSMTGVTAYEYNGNTLYYNKDIKLSKREQRSLVRESLVVITLPTPSHSRKKSARMILDFIMGKENANELIRPIAVVEDRNDRLVRQWRKKVVKRDGRCTECGSVEKLQAHHMSHWADDPMNRINPDNGITLCASCHAEEHPEISNLIMSVGERHG